MSLQWFAAEMLTGDVIAYLPSLDIGDTPLQRIISTPTSVDATLHLSGAPENWDRATEPIASWLACYDDTDPLRAILWVGYVNYRNPSAADDTLALTIVTAEGILETRYVDDVTYLEGAYRNDVAASLLVSYLLVDAGDDVGLHGVLDLDYTASAGPTLDADLVLQNADNATVGVRLRQLFARLGGEFTVDWAWGSDGQTSIAATLRFGTHIGTRASGSKPPVQYQLPGQLLDFQRPEDFSVGKFANKVVAYSTGSGSLVPYADPVYAPADPNRPTVEYRYQPVPNTSPGGLVPYAQGAAKILAPGGRAVKLTATLENVTSRRFGIDWKLGDDIGYKVSATDRDGRPILAFPGGVEGVGRAIGVEISPQANTITPVLAEATVYVESDS